MRFLEFVRVDLRVSREMLTLFVLLLLAFDVMSVRIILPPLMTNIAVSKANIEDISHRGQWIIKTSVIGGLICLLPTPISFEMKIGVLAIVMGSLIIQSGSEATSKSIVKVGQSIEIAAKDIRLGLKDAENGIGGLG